MEVGDYEIPLHLPTPSTIFQDETGIIFVARPSSSPAPSRMNLRPTTYVTTKQAKNDILDNKNVFEDGNDVTTDTSNHSEPYFDDSDDDEFDPILGASMMLRMVIWTQIRYRTGDKVLLVSLILWKK